MGHIKFTGKICNGELEWIFLVITIETHTLPRKRKLLNVSVNQEVCKYTNTDNVRPYKVGRQAQPKELDSFTAYRIECSRLTSNALYSTPKSVLSPHHANPTTSTSFTKITA